MKTKLFMLGIPLGLISTALAVLLYNAFAVIDDFWYGFFEGFAFVALLIGVLALINYIRAKNK